MKHIGVRIRRLFRSPNTQGVTKLALEALVLLILGWLLYETISCPASVRFLPIKLTQLLIAAVASGALLHAWRRWTGQRRERAPSTILLSWCSFWNVPLSLAWLGLSVLAWGTFGQGMLWDFNRSLWILDRPSHGGATAGDTEIIGTYLGVVGLIIALITGYYLVILHRVTDRAEATLEFLKTRYDERLKELADLIATEERTSDDLAARETRFRGEVLTPMLAELLLLGDQVFQSPPGRAEYFKRLTRRLQAEAAVFRLCEVDTASQFITAWRDVQAYEDVFKEEPWTFRYLFRKTERNLESLFEKGLALRDDERLREAVEALYEYARYGA